MYVFDICHNLPVENYNYCVAAPRKNKIISPKVWKLRNFFFFFFPMTIPDI